MSTTFSYLLKVDRVSFGEGERDRTNQWHEATTQGEAPIVLNCLKTRALASICRATRSGTDRIVSLSLASTRHPLREFDGSFCSTHQPPTRNSSAPFVCSPFSQIFSLCAFGLRSCSVTLSRDPERGSNLSRIFLVADASIVQDFHERL